MPGALYDRIGSAYDATRRADSYIVGRLLVHLQLQAGQRHLDVACGTGNYSWALAKAGLTVTGVDASPRMITAAVAKGGAQRSAVRASPKAAPRTTPAAGAESAGTGATSAMSFASPLRRPPVWVVGDVRHLPFKGTTFDGATCTLALRYFDDLEVACHEFGRILAGGRLVIFTATPPQIRRYWLRTYFPEMVARVAAQAYPLERIVAALDAAGFVNVRTEPYAVQPDVEDLFLYSGKHRPELYLNPAVRAGMWSFTTLASLEEEAAGCAALRRDLASGRVRTVIHEAAREESRSFVSTTDPGDYLFVIADHGGG
jgi:ubiquinone/menaquinone biosynthesis C-methylase UbiE